MINQELETAFCNVQEKLNQSSNINCSDSPQEQSKLIQNNNLLNFLKSEAKALSKENSDRLFNEFTSFGPIEKLIHQNEITEIIINAPKNIWFEADGEFHKHTDEFLSESTYLNFIHKLCKLSNIKLNLETPCANGQWNNFRVHVIQPPLVPTNIAVTLRRHPKNSWSITKLINANWANEANAFKLCDLVEKKKNILIIGPTGSGKTSVLNSLLNQIPNSERVICIEDTSEVVLPNHISTKLLTRMDNNQELRSFSQADLVKEALRMRPDRLIMGEVRGSEAKDFILALSTGHPGSLATLHASSPQQALWRLELLIQLGAPTWNIHSIRGLIQLGIDYIVSVGMKNKKRQLLGIHKVASLEDHGFTVDTVFKL